MAKHASETTAGVTLHKRLCIKKLKFPENRTEVNFHVLWSAFCVHHCP